MPTQPAERWGSKGCCPTGSLLSLLSSGGDKGTDLCPTCVSPANVQTKGNALMRRPQPRLGEMFWKPRPGLLGGSVVTVSTVGEHLCAYPFTHCPTPCLPAFCYPRGER